MRQLFLQNLVNSFQKDVEKKAQANKNIKLWFVSQQKFWIFLALLAFKIEAAPYVETVCLVTIKEKCFRSYVLQNCGNYWILS